MTESINQNVFKLITLLTFLSDTYLSDTYLKPLTRCSDKNLAFRCQFNSAVHVHVEMMVP